MLEWLTPGDLPNPGTELGSPEFHVDSLPAELPGKPWFARMICTVRKIVFSCAYINIFNQNIVDFQCCIIFTYTAQWLLLYTQIYIYIYIYIYTLWKNLPAMQETQVWSLGQKTPLEKGMTTHSSILAWRIPWTEEPGGLQSMGLQRVGHDWPRANTVGPRGLSVLYTVVCTC